MDSGLALVPDTGWHTFSIEEDLASRTYIRMRVDGQTQELGGIELARAPHPDWGSEVALIATTESLAAWPQANCELVFTWTTNFRNLRLEFVSPR